MEFRESTAECKIGFLFRDSLPRMFGTHRPFYTVYIIEYINVVLCQDFRAQTDIYRNPKARENGRD